MTEFNSKAVYTKIECGWAGAPGQKCKFYSLPGLITPKSFKDVTNRVKNTQLIR